MNSKYLISCDFMDVPRKAEICWQLKELQHNWLLLVAFTFNVKRPEGIYLQITYMRHSTVGYFDFVPYFIDYLIKTYVNNVDFVEIPRYLYNITPQLRVLGFVPSPDNPDTAICYMKDRRRRPRPFSEE